MKRIPRYLCAVLSLAVFSQASSPHLFSQVPSPPSGMENQADTGPSKRAPSRLEEISTRLAVLNGQLKSELEDSKRSLDELAHLLETSREELSALQASSMELELRAQSSEQALKELSMALAKANASLESLERSFAAWKALSDATIERLERSRTRSRVACMVLGTLAVGGWTAFLLAAD